MDKSIENKENKPGAPVTLRWPNLKSKDLSDRIHRTVLNGRYQKLYHLVTSMPDFVNVFNKQGQTPLFCAALLGKGDIVALLINLGANPNGRCQRGGYTPLHGACYSGDVNSLKLLIQAGGDLRLTDENGDKPIDWTIKHQIDEGKIRAIRELIERVRICMLQTNGTEIVRGMGQNFADRHESLFRALLQDFCRKSDLEIHAPPSHGRFISKSVQSTGFGKIYFGNGLRSANVQGVPYIKESDLQLEDKQQAPSWSCGKFTEFSPYLWIERRTEVATRKLRKQAGDGALPDILISELEVHGKLRHPNILMLMAVCQTENLNSLFLIYERIQLGSLHFLLHIQRKTLKPRFISDIVIQIAEALEYMHSFGLIHCGLTSHSIMLTRNGVAKLSCLEYTRKTKTGRFESSVVDSHPLFTSDLFMKDLYHWLAPEALVDFKFTKKGDLYSLCAIIWEICTLQVPWNSLGIDQLRDHFRISNEGLPLDDKFPTPWVHIMKLGLATSPEDRDIELAEIIEILKNLVMKQRIDKKGSLQRGCNSISMKLPLIPSFKSNQFEGDYEKKLEIDYNEGSVDVVDDAVAFDDENELNRSKVECFLARRGFKSPSANTSPMSKELERQISKSPMHFRSKRGIPRNAVELFPSDLKEEIRRVQRGLRVVKEYSGDAALFKKLSPGKIPAIKQEAFHGEDHGDSIHPSHSLFFKQQVPRSFPSTSKPQFKFFKQEPQESVRVKEEVYSEDVSNSYFEKSPSKFKPGSHRIDMAVSFSPMEPRAFERTESSGSINNLVNTSLNQGIKPAGHATEFHLNEFPTSARQETDF